MAAPPPLTWARLWRWQMALALFATILVGAARFRFLSEYEAKWLLLKGGYWLIAGTTGLFALFLWKRLAAIEWSKAAWKTHRAGIVCVLLCALFLQIHEKRTYKVLFDEFVIDGVARNMHFNREATFPTHAHYINGRITIFGNGLDKRPFFFAFLLSLVHDLTGYREANAFYLNGGLAAVLLALVYLFGFRAGGVRYGCLGVLLLTSLPLLAQNATGGGFEVINLVMICGLFLAGADYLRSPGVQGLDLFVFIAVLLAQARYESILYTLVVPVVVLGKWFRTREVGLTWASSLAPLLLLPCLLVNKIGFGDPSRFQLKPGQTAFALANFYDNFSHAIVYLFGCNFNETNSLLISVAGIIALVFLVMLLARGFTGSVRTGSSDTVLACILAVVFVNTVIEFSYFWGHWDDAMVSRFSLPLQLMLVLAVLRVLREFLKHRPLPQPVLLAAVTWILLFTAPVNARHFASGDIYTAQEYSWFHDYLATKSPAETLSVTASSLGPILQGYPAISIDAAKALKWQLKACLEGGFYREIIILQRFQIDNQTGKLVEKGPSQLGDGFVLQTLAELHARPNVVSRISRFIDVKGEVKPPPHFDEEKPPFEDDDALVGHLLRKLP
ncbi:MAG TPA: hypothetical protein VK717_08710 [Opitutaceae bacterium]|nr:hypothetical protein [Opitutaceae bacterium]